MSSGSRRKNAGDAAGAGRAKSKKKKKPVSYQIVIIGSGAVGKSAVTVQFTNREFMEVYDPTVEDRYTREIVVDGEPASLNILDTAGQSEVFTGLQDKWFREGEGFMMMFSVTDEESLEGLTKRRDRMLIAREGMDSPAVLVGNKIDLKRKRRVDRAAGESLASIFDVPYLESSAKEYINVEESFAELVRQIRKSRVLHGKPKEKRKASGTNTAFPVHPDERENLRSSSGLASDKGKCLVS